MSLTVQQHQHVLENKHALLGNVLHMGNDKQTNWLQCDRTQRSNMISKQLLSVTWSTESNCKEQICKSCCLPPCDNNYWGKALLFCTVESEMQVQPECKLLAVSDTKYILPC